MTEEETLEVIRTEARKGAYFWLIMVATVVFASGGSILISVGIAHRVNERSLAREQTAREASERAFCGIIILLDDSYNRTPPATEAGRQLAKAVSNARIVNHCPPRSGE